LLQGFACFPRETGWPGTIPVGQTSVPPLHVPGMSVKWWIRRSAPGIHRLAGVGKGIDTFTSQDWYFRLTAGCTRRVSESATTEWWAMLDCTRSIWSGGKQNCDCGGRRRAARPRRREMVRISVDKSRLGSTLRFAAKQTSTRQPRAPLDRYATGGVPPRAAL